MYTVYILYIYFSIFKTKTPKYVEYYDVSSFSFSSSCLIGRGGLFGVLVFSLSQQTREADADAAVRF